MTTELIILTKEAFNEINAKLDAILLQSNKSPAASENLLNNKEAAAFLKVSKSTLQSYRNEGKISFVQIDRKILYRQSDLQEFIACNKFSKQ